MVPSRDRNHKLKLNFLDFSAAGQGCLKRMKKAPCDCIGAFFAGP